MYSPKPRHLPFWALFLAVVLILVGGIWLDSHLIGNRPVRMSVELLVILGVLLVSNRWLRTNF